MEPKRERLASPLIVVLVGLVGVAWAISVSVPRFGSFGPSRREGTIGDIKGLRDGVRLFARDNGRYPTSEEGLAALLQAPADLVKTWIGPYIDHEGSDAWGHAYHYVISAGVKGGFNIVSAGADGVEGTEDDIDVHTVK